MLKEERVLALMQAIITGQTMAQMQVIYDHPEFKIGESTVLKFLRNDAYDIAETALFLEKAMMRMLEVENEVGVM